MATREQRLIDTFTHIADTLVNDFDADEVLHVLAERCVELLDVDAAGVMLAMRPGELRAVAATSRDMRQLEILEVASTEGPSYDAYRTGRPIVEHDLAGAGERWPTLAARAHELGFGRGYGFPLRLRDRTIGALNLFQAPERRALTDADVDVARGFADIAAIALIQEELVRDTQATVEQLTHALSTRVTIEQAKGVLAERLGVTPAAAFDRLRKHARDHNRKLRDIARDIVDGRIQEL
jgi:GAF domain-containing protein